MRDEWTDEDGFIDIGEDDSAALLFDGTLDTWYKDTTGKWHYKPVQA